MIVTLTNYVGKTGYSHRKNESQPSSNIINMNENQKT